MVELARLWGADPVQEEGQAEEDGDGVAGDAAPRPPDAPASVPPPPHGPLTAVPTEPESCSAAALRVQPIKVVCGVLSYCAAEGGFFTAGCVNRLHRNWVLTRGVSSMHAHLCVVL